MNSYNEYEKVIKLGETGEVNIEHSKAQYIKQFDELCDECSLYQPEKLLCEGIRPFVVEHDSINLQSIRLAYRPCEKRMLLDNQERVQVFLANSWLPKSYLQTLPSAKVGYFRLTDNCTYSRVSVATTKRFFETVSNVIHGGYKSRYVYVPALLNGYNKYLENLNEDLIDYPALLAVDGLDLAVGAKIRREALISVLEQRVSQGKATHISLSDSPKSDDKREQAFYDQVMQWPKI